MPQTQIKNEVASGTCAKCKQPSDRIIAPPLISPPDWHEVGVIGDDARWILGGIERKYNLAFEAGVMYLRPQAIPHDPICWKCFAESVSPLEWPLVVNKADNMSVWFNVAEGISITTWGDQ